MNSESDNNIINSISSELHPETTMYNSNSSSSNSDSFSWFNTFFLFLGFLFILFIGFNIYLYFIETKDKTQQQAQEQPLIKENGLEKTLNEPPLLTTNIPSYNSDEATSAIQSTGTKAGWCFIGEDRAFRTCAKVNETDQCMSGNIFPSKDICINPTLR